MGFDSDYQNKTTTSANRLEAQLAVRGYRQRVQDILRPETSQQPYIAKTKGNSFIRNRERTTTNSSDFSEPMTRSATSKFRRQSSNVYESKLFLPSSTSIQKQLAFLWAESREKNVRKSMINQTQTKVLMDLKVQSLQDLDNLLLKQSRQCYFTADQLLDIYEAKCADNNTSYCKDQAVTFLEKLLKSSKRRKESLNLVNESLGPRAANILAKLLYCKANITIINVSGNKFGDDGIGSFARSLSTLPDLIQLDVSNCGIGANGFKILFYNLARMQTLTALKLSTKGPSCRNNLGKIGAQWFTLFAKECQTLLFLEMRNVGISRVNYQCIADGLKDKDLVYLDISRNNLKGPSLRSFLQQLSVPNLQSLIFNQIEIDLLSLESFCSLMERRCQGIRTLSLVDNKFNQDQLLYFLQRISKLPNLTTLILDGAHLKRTNLYDFVVILEKMTNIQKLSLRKCAITGSIQYFIEGLLLNKSIQSLNLSHNNLQNNGAQQIARLLSNSTSLRELILEHCNIWSEGALAIGQGLEKNITLERLNLRKNFINDASCQDLISRIRKNASLSEILLEGNSMSETTKKQLETLSHDIAVHRRMSRETENLSKQRNILQIFNRQKNQIARWSEQARLKLDVTKKLVDDDEIIVYKAQKQNEFKDKQRRAILTRLQLLKASIETEQLNEIDEEDNEDTKYHNLLVGLQCDSQKIQQDVTTLKTQLRKIGLSQEKSFKSSQGYKSAVTLQKDERETVTNKKKEILPDNPYMITEYIDN